MRYSAAKILPLNKYVVPDVRIGPMQFWNLDLGFQIPDLIADFFQFSSSRL
jgi:hypothetical protein